MKGFFYLATPYSKWDKGIEDAYQMASREAARFIKAGIPVFCPISHTHPIAIHGDMNPLDHGVWIPADKPFMDAAIGLIVVRAKGWEKSYGIGVEIKAFQDAGKPVMYFDPIEKEEKPGAIYN